MLGPIEESFVHKIYLNRGILKEQEKQAASEIGMQNLPGVIFHWCKSLTLEKNRLWSHGSPEFEEAQWD